MQWRDRQGNILPGDAGQDALLQWMYGTKAGALLVKIMIRPGISRFAGLLLSTRLSALAVGPFCAKHKLDLSDYPPQRYRSFNDFFTRQVLPGKRPIAPEGLMAPCDSKLSVYPIEPDTRFRIKHTDYTLEGLLRSPELAERFAGGQLLLFRLTVGDYHRYCFPDDGEAGPVTRIDGVFHTVNPAANDRYPIYKENTREYCLLESEHFGTMLLMEVGAAMVGKIRNLPVTGSVLRGQEKGMFEFGGSTVIVLLEKGRAEIDPDILSNTANKIETVVKQGMRIGSPANPA